MIDEKTRYDGEGTAYPYDEEGIVSTSRTDGGRHITGERDVFGNEENHQIKYKTLSWQLVAVLMVAEIVSNGMLSLPSSGGVVGLVPNVILIVFLGIFGTFTAYLLVQFKLNHPEVHNMGDAGYILFGVVGREVLSAGTVIFAVFATGGQLLSASSSLPVNSKLDPPVQSVGLFVNCSLQLLAGQIALGVLSDSKLCLMLYTGIFAIPTLIFSFPRTLDGLSWLCIPSVISIFIAGIVGMVGAGINPLEGRTTSLFLQPSFVNAFVSITNPVFAYAGHFMFFILISEMRNPKDAMKAAYVLQGFATTYYTVFAIVTHWYLGDSVVSPSFSSLPTVWAKAAYGITIPNFLIAGSLYAHTAAKLIFLRLFRNSDHLHSHTVVGWGAWSILILIMNGAAFVLAVGVPIFSYLIGIAASLFASWYTYGIAGAFWIHDSYYLSGQGSWAWRRKPVMFALSVLTFVAGGFICVAGTYVIIKLIIDAYDSGTVPPPFQC